MTCIMYTGLLELFTVIVKSVDVSVELRKRDETFETSSLTKN